VSPVEVLALVVVVLAIPIAAGMAVGHRFPDFARRAEPRARMLTLGLFLVVVALAFSKNMALFLDTMGSLVPVVVLHNAGALAVGFATGALLRLSVPDRRAVTLEVGIQNSGLGLAVAFTFMPQLGDVILVTALWGVWHLVAGLTLALVWARIREPVPVTA
jgi:bile acid:Na+ symporter, BASS family